MTDFSFGQNVDVTFRSSVSGSFSDFAQPNFESYATNIARTETGAVLSDILLASVGYRGTAGDDLTVNTVETAPDFRTFNDVGDWAQFGRSVFEGTLTLFGGLVNEVSIELGLRGDRVSSFGNTARLELITDLDYTSASGTFLSGEPEPPAIPLPAGLPLIFTALAGLGALRLRRRQAA